MRDFSQDNNKDAACKNAFTLLGQHRHELAAAFFVLGDLSPHVVSLGAPPPPRITFYMRPLPSPPLCLPPPADFLPATPSLHFLYLPPQTPPPHPPFHL